MMGSGMVPRERRRVKRVASEASFTERSPKRLALGTPGKDSMVVVVEAVEAAKAQLEREPFMGITPAKKELPVETPARPPVPPPTPASALPGSAVPAPKKHLELQQNKSMDTSDPAKLPQRNIKLSCLEKQENSVRKPTYRLEGDEGEIAMEEDGEQEDTNFVEEEENTEDQEIMEMEDKLRKSHKLASSGI